MHGTDPHNRTSLIQIVSSVEVDKPVTPNTLPSLVQALDTCFIMDVFVFGIFLLFPHYFSLPLSHNIGSKFITC